MEIYLARQTLTFGYACLLGAAFGAVYDLFRVLRAARSPGKGAVFAQDLVFFLFCSAGTFLFLLVQNEGVLRLFLLAGEFLGAVVYFLTLGGIVTRGAGRAIRGVARVFRLMKRYLFRPIWRVFYVITSTILRPFRFLWRFLKKTGQRSRFRLKTQRLVLYNLIVGYWARKKAAKVTKGEQN
jgi:spore cortex biosynthesis protein YabQ